MDISKFLELGIEYFSDYFQVFFLTLQKPSLRFHPVSVTPKETSISSQPIGVKLNPLLFGFLVINIFIGTIFSSMAFGNLEISNFVSTTVVMIAIWIVYSSFIHGFCKLLKGKGTYLDTLSISLQLLAVTYVISSLITLIWITVIKILPPESYVLLETKNNYLAYFVFTPTIFYFMAHSTIMGIYIPPALKFIHGFTSTRLAIVGLISAFMTLSVAIILSIISKSNSIATTSIYESLIPATEYSQITNIPYPTPINSYPMIDIFPNIGNGEIFSTFSDGTLTIAPIDDCAMEGRYGLRISYDLKNDEWGVVGIVWGRESNKYFNASSFRSLSFWVKGGWR